jgi:hypothetical protein
MQTATEWLFEKLLKAEPNILEWNKYLEQAKRKEKEQIINDYHKGQMGIADLYKESLQKIGVYEELLTDFEDAEEYYNQTYNQNNNK